MQGDINVALLANDNLNVNRISKQLSRGIDRLPLAFVGSRGGGGEEDDPQCDLRAGPRRVEWNLSGRAEGLTVDVPQAVARVPVAGAAVLDQPLFIHGLARQDDGVVFEG